MRGFYNSTAPLVENDTVPIIIDNIAFTIKTGHDYSSMFGSIALVIFVLFFGFILVLKLVKSVGMKIAGE